MRAVRARAIPKKRPSELRAPLSFVAIDFETADYGRDSACAVGLVRVSNGEIVERAVTLIRPPRSQFIFTGIHGITWPMVAGEGVFGEVWPKVAPLLEGADFLAAHNASFDRSVLSACCAAAGVSAPALEFQCTVQLARQTWGLRPANLPAVCAHLGIGLKHHDAGSDAEACARIVIAAAAASEEIGRRHLDPLRLRSTGMTGREQGAAIGRAV
jgi:DNA polymerase-3 subunit epsilon